METTDNVSAVYLGISIVFALAVIIWVIVRSEYYVDDYMDEELDDDYDDQSYR